MVHQRLVERGHIHSWLSIRESWWEYVDTGELLILKSWDNYRPCNNLNLRTSLKTTFYTSMCWISTTKEETTAALNRCHRLAGELDKRVPRGGRGEREELRHAPGPRLSQLHEHTHTQATFSILRGTYFNWKFYTALLTKFEGIMNSWFFFNFYQKRTQSELPMDTLRKKVGWQNTRRTVRSPLAPTECGMSIADSRERPTMSAAQDKDKPTS